MRKKIIKSTLLLGTLLLGIILFSPYKYDEQSQNKIIDIGIEIDKSCPEVYAYLGKSANAGRWSVYVDHIKPLNSNEVADGKVGSVRRCFKQADEQGVIWDEEITQAIPGLKRQLSIFNPKGFLMVTDGLMTEQIYRSLGQNKTMLNLRLFNKNKDLGLVDELKTHIASYYIAYIFRSNLQNIKQQVEHAKP